MRKFNLRVIILLLVAPAGALLAQDAADDQAAVWAAVEEIWAAQERGGTDWVDDRLTGNCRARATFRLEPPIVNSTGYKLRQTMSNRCVAWPCRTIMHDSSEVKDSSVSQQTWKHVQ